MSRIIRTAAVAVALAMSAAAAQAASPITIAVGDIDPSTPAGAKELRARTYAAAREVCRESGPGAMSRCVRAADLVAA